MIQLIDHLGKQVSISAGIKIYYQTETKCIFFCTNSGRKLYSTSHEEKFCISLHSYDQFIELAWLIAQLSQLRIKSCYSPDGVYACEFINI